MSKDTRRNRRVRLFAATQASPCGFHGAMDGNWTPMHPRSLGVAVEILRARQRLRQFGLTLRDTPVAVLFVESGLWTRSILERRVSASQALEQGLFVRVEPTP